MMTRLLIVDDSRQVREFLKMTLAGVAEVVGECADGADALDAYVRLRPDWVLMDVEMKNVDGITATRQIIEAYPLALVLIVTNHNDDILSRAALEAGAFRYIVKENLLDIVDVLAKAETS